MVISFYSVAFYSILKNMNHLKVFELIKGLFNDLSISWLLPFCYGQCICFFIFLLRKESVLKKGAFEKHNFSCLCYDHFEGHLSYQQTIKTCPMLCCNEHKRVTLRLKAVRCAP